MKLLKSERVGENASVVDGLLLQCLDQGQGTAPETLLLIETVAEKGNSYWAYAFMRASEVWTAEKFPQDSDPQGSHLTV